MKFGARGNMFSGRNRSAVAASVVFVLASSFLPAHAQQDGVAALRSQMLQTGSAYRVNVAGLHATTDVLGRPSENRIQDGVVTRGSSRWLHGKTDVAIAHGEIVTVRNIEAATDARSDLLRVEIVAQGADVPLVFAVAKGSLAAMSTVQLQSLVSGVLQPVPAATPPPVVQSPIAAPPSAPPAVVPAAAVPLDSPTVKKVKARMVNGQITFLKAGNLRGAMSSPDLVRDNVVADGAVDRSTPTGMYRGMRSMGFPPYQQVEVVDVLAASNADHDILKVIARAPIGAFIPIAFVVGKGELAKMTELQMMHLIAPVVGLPGERNPHPPDNDSL